MSLVWAYMALLGFGATISPGIGMSGQLIAILPQAATELSHVPAYGLLTWLLTGSLHKRGWTARDGLIVAIAVALIFGLWMEIVQVFVPGRVVDMDDVLLNTVGIAMAACLILWRRVSVEHEAQSSGSSFCPDIR